MGLIFYIILGLAIIFSAFYGWLIANYLRAWNALPEQQLPKQFSPKIGFSILVPARNEALNIQACLDAILAQDYPSDQFEIIVIDDFSEDKTPDLVLTYQNPQVRLIQLQDHLDPNKTQAFKKSGIDLGIQSAQFDYIVCTDADCTMGSLWLRHLAYAFENQKAVLLAAPVLFNDSNRIMGRFQQLDFLGMMGVNAAGLKLAWHALGNGANLAYSKQAFHSVQGFQGIDHLASGDDLMLMQKVDKKYPNQVHFVKSLAAATYTDVKPSWSEFLSQRIRWATKTQAYPDQRVTGLWALIWMFVTGMVICLISGLLLDQNILFILLGMLVWKASWDFLFLQALGRFFNRHALLRLPVFLPSFLLENIYIFSVGILGNVVKEYHWKGRKTR